MREQSSRCHFCAAALVADRSPFGGFFGVLLGVSIAACGGNKDDDDDGAGSMSASETMTASAEETSATDSATIGNDSSSATEITGPLYGPVTFDTASGDTSGGSEATDDASGSTEDTGSTGTTTDTGDSTTVDPSETAGPLYGPATSN